MHNVKACYAYRVSAEPSVMSGSESGHEWIAKEDEQIKLPESFKLDQHWAEHVVDSLDDTYCLADEPIVLPDDADQSLASSAKVYSPDPYVPKSYGLGVVFYYAQPKALGFANPLIEGVPQPTTVEDDRAKLEASGLGWDALKLVLKAGGHRRHCERQRYVLAALGIDKVAEVDDRTLMIALATLVLDHSGIGGWEGVTGDSGGRVPALQGIPGKQSPSGDAWDSATHAAQIAIYDELMSRCLTMWLYPQSGFGLSVDLVDDDGISAIPGEPTAIEPGDPLHGWASSYCTRQLGQALRRDGVSEDLVGQFPSDRPDYHAPWSPGDYEAGFRPEDWADGFNAYCPDEGV